MHALISGITGSALLVDGDNFSSLKVDDSELLRASPGEVRQFLARAHDAYAIENVEVDDARVQLEAACEATAIFNLVQILLSNVESNSTRSLAGEELDESLQDELAKEIAERRLMSALLPKRRHVPNECSHRVRRFIQRLEYYQPDIAKVLESFNNIASENFQVDSQLHVARDRFLATSIREPIFRTLVLCSSGEKKLADVLSELQEECYCLKSIPGHRKIVTEWVAALELSEHPVDFERVEPDDVAQTRKRAIMRPVGDQSQAEEIVVEKNTWPVLFPKPRDLFKHRMPEPVPTMKLQVFDIWGPLRRRKYLIALSCLIGAGLSYLYYSKSPKIYSSSTELMISTLVDGNSQPDKVSLATHSRLLVSELVLGDAVSTGKFAELETFEGFPNPVNALREGMIDCVVETDEILTLICTGPVQKDLPLILNQLVEAYKKNVLGEPIKIRMLYPPKYGQQIAPSLPKSLALGITLAFLMGLGLAILVDQSELSYDSPQEIFERLKVPVVGRIPRIKMRRVDAKLGHPSLIAAHNPSSTAAESFREVRTGLFFRSNHEDIKTVLITSPSSGDGKSTTVANLAISIAQAGKRVILVDADFRRPRVHQYFGEEIKPGSLDALSGELNLKDAIKVSRLQDNLFLLTAGGRPANPGELLTSEEFRNLVEALREKFDYVLIDSPPVLQVSDPAMMAGIVDGVYLVIRLRKGVKLASQKAKETLDCVGANCMGVIVNGVDENPHYSQYGYQYGSYLYYGGMYGKYYDSRDRAYRERIKVVDVSKVEK